MENCNIQKVWTQLKKSCEFDKRRSEVDSFNENNRWKKRGIAMIPTKFGISFTTKFLNQVRHGLNSLILKLSDQFLA